MEEVIISVHGGIAYVEKKTIGVQIVIQDFDSDRDNPSIETYEAGDEITD
jgi:hypothetical protein